MMLLINQCALVNLRWHPLPTRDQSWDPSLPARMLHANQWYYDPIGLPLPSKDFHHRLICVGHAAIGQDD